MTHGCGCKPRIPAPICRSIGCCAVAFSVGVITSLLITSGTAAVLVAVAAGGIGIAFLR